MDIYDVKIIKPYKLFCDTHLIPGEKDVFLQNYRYLNINEIKSKKRGWRKVPGVLSTIYARCKLSIFF